jgi:hypothetical protein
LTKNAQNDINGTSVMETNQNTTNINGKKKTYKVVLESSQTLIAVTALMKEEGRPRSHFHKPIASVCHMTPRCENALLLHECFSNFVFCFDCDGWQN